METSQECLKIIERHSQVVSLVEQTRSDSRLQQGGSGRTFQDVGTADIEWLNTAETARRLGITTRTLYRFIDDGQLPAYRIGRVIRLKETEVSDFIDSCRIEPGSLADGTDSADASAPSDADA